VLPGVAAVNAAIEPLRIVVAIVAVWPLLELAVYPFEVVAGIAGAGPLGFVVAIVVV